MTWRNCRWDTLQAGLGHPAPSSNFIFTGCFAPLPKPKFQTNIGQATTYIVALHTRHEPESETLVHHNHPQPNEGEKHTCHAN